MRQDDRVCLTPGSRHGGTLSPADGGGEDKSGVTEGGIGVDGVYRPPMGSFRPTDRERTAGSDQLEASV